MDVPASLMASAAVKWSICPRPYPPQCGDSCCPSHLCQTLQLLSLLMITQGARTAKFHIARFCSGASVGRAFDDPLPLIFRHGRQQRQEPLTAKPPKSTSASPSSTVSVHSAPPRSSASPKFRGERGSQASRGRSATTPFWIQVPSSKGLPHPES